MKWVCIDVLLNKIQSWPGDPGKTSNQQRLCEPGQRTKAVYNGKAMVTVGKHLFLAGISGSSHVCDI